MLVTDYFGQQVEEARAGGDWACASPYPSWLVSGSSTCVSLGTGALEQSGEACVSPGLGSGSRQQRESAPSPHPGRAMCTCPGMKHGLEDPRQEQQLLGWEYEDCCALRKEDVAGVSARRREARCNDRPRARRQNPGCWGADSGWDDYKRGEGISVDQQTTNGDCGGFWKEDIQYVSCRKAEGVWEGKSRDTEGRNCRLYETEGVKYRNCSSEIREGWYREDRVPGQYMEGEKEYGENRGPGNYRRRERCQNYRDTRDYSEDERHYGENERWYRQWGDSGEFREEKKWYRQDGGSGAYREKERRYRGVRDQVDQEDTERHRQTKSHVVDHNSLDRSSEALAFTVWSSGDSSVSPGSGICYTQSKTWDMDYDSRGELEGATPGTGMPARSSRGAERSRVRTGRPDWSQVWEQEAEEANRVGSMLQRNSFYRRTAPSTLRRSEFVQTRKEKRGTRGNAGQLSWVCFCPALALGQHQGCGTGGCPAQPCSHGKPWTC